MKKDLFYICIVVFILIFVLKGTKIQSVDDYYLTHIDDITDESDTVFFSIRCDTILDNWDKLDPQLKYEKYVPSNGVILQRSEYVLRKGDSVYDILNRAIRYNKIQMECVYSVNYESLGLTGYLTLILIRHIIITLHHCIEKSCTILHNRGVHCHNRN